MKQRLTILALTGLYWLLFFSVSRIFFLAYHYTSTSLMSFSDILKTMVLGIRMDAAMGGYWLLFTGLLLTASAMKSARGYEVVHRIIVCTLLTVSCTIVVLDAELYRHWGFRMDMTPLTYVSSEGVASAQVSSIIVLVISMAVLWIGFFFLYQRFISCRFLNLPQTRPAWALVMLGVTALLFLPIRSSISVAPLNTGVVYYHRTLPFANHAGINVVWNFLESVTTQEQLLYPENMVNTTEATDRLKRLNASGSSKRIVNGSRPNILLIVMEGFTSKIIKPLGGIDGITPSFNQLAQEGVMFSNFFASGDRTAKGIVAILSGYPAQPKTSIILHPGKTQSLSFLPKELAKIGYHTSFVYGGDIGFFNMESFMTLAGFAQVTDDDDFDFSIPQSKWGVRDEYAFDRTLAELDTTQAPFFKVLLTLSSHEPFDVPLNTPFLDGGDEESLFLNSCRYADQELGRFISNAKQKAWWQNTWVIVTADHGHRYPGTEDLQSRSRFTIPMLWIGGAVPQRDSVITTLGSQTDIANTILGQLDGPLDQFTFSKDLLGNQVHPYAVYIYNNGYGYVDPGGWNQFDFDYGEFTEAITGEAVLENGKAYMQVLFSDYNNR